MAIDTIDAAFEDMGRQLRLKMKPLAEAARRSLQAGGSFEVLISVSQEKAGASVTMRSRAIHGQTTLGRLIRLK